MWINIIYVCCLYVQSNNSSVLIYSHYRFLQMVIHSCSQVPIDGVSSVDGGDSAGIPMPIHTFCHQISGAEFEKQKLASSQKAMEELLEVLLTDQNISEKERRKKLKQVTKPSKFSVGKVPQKPSLKGFVDLITKTEFLKSTLNTHCPCVCSGVYSPVYGPSGPCGRGMSVIQFWLWLYSFF